MDLRTLMVSSIMSDISSLISFFLDNPLYPSTLGHRHLTLQILLQSRLDMGRNFVLDFYALRSLRLQSRQHCASHHDLIGHGHHASQELLFF